MPASPFFSGRIPQELLDAVEKHRALTGESKTDVLVRSLAKYVSYELPEVEIVEPPIQLQIDEILQRLEAIETELEINRKVPAQNSNPSKKQLGLQLDNSEITQDNKDENTKILTTHEALEVVGIGRSTLSEWKTRKLLPRERNGYRIDFDHSDKSPKQSFWKVTKL